MGTKVGSKDRFDIPPEVMTYLRDLWCPSTTTSDEMFGAINDVRLGEKDSVERLLDIYRRFAVKKFEFCDRGTGATTWGWGRGDVEKGSEEKSYTLNLRWWDLFTLFPGSVADSAVLCEMVSSWVNSASLSLPLDLELFFNSKEDKVKDKKWFKDRKEEYVRRRNACIDGAKPKYSPEEGEYFVARPVYDGREFLLEHLCLSAAEMLVPPKEESVPTCTQDQFECAKYVQQMNQPFLLGQPAPDKKEPPEELKEILRKRLRGIPWHTWVQMEGYCMPISDMTRTIGYIRDFFYTAYGLRWLYPVARALIVGKAVKDVFSGSPEGKIIGGIVSRIARGVKGVYKKVMRKIRPPRGSIITGLLLGTGVAIASLLSSREAGASEDGGKRFMTREEHKKWVMEPLSPISSLLCYLMDCSEAY
jgi:hypothetical protein